MKKKNGKYVNKEIAEAFLKFAQSDVGIEFLSKFAEEGQVIAGHEYTESGEFDMQGIDLVFKAENINWRLGEDSSTQGESGPNANTHITGGPSYMEHLERGTINIRVNTSLNNNSKEAQAYKENSDDPMAKLVYILSRTNAIFHEVIIHANSIGEDMTDNCQIDGSYISGNSGNRIYDQHINAKESGSLYLKKVLPVMINMHKEGKTGMSKDYIKKRMLDYKD